MADGGAWTLSLLCRRDGILLQLWKPWGLLGILSGSAQRLFAYLDAAGFCNTRAYAQELHFRLPECRFAIEGSATPKANGGLAESSREPATSGADEPAFRVDMRAWMSRKLRAQTAASDVSQISPYEDSVSSRDSGGENAAAASAIEKPVARTSVRDEASTSCGFRPSSHGSSDSLGSSQAPSTRNKVPAAEAPTSQPSCSVSAEHEACIVWPRPLLETSEESSETSAPGSVGFFPFFGVRNILNFSKKDGKGKLFSRKNAEALKNAEGASQSETEAIESDVLKWETYESPCEEPQPRKYTGRTAIPEARTHLTPDGSSERPCSDANQKTMACTVQDITAYEPSTDNFAVQMDLVRLANEISPHSPTDVEGDEHSDEGEGARDHVLWSTLFDGRNRRSSLDAMSADDIKIGEKVAAWDPSQEDNYALQSPGQMELFDVEAADPRDRQASQKLARFGACNEHAVNHALSQLSKKDLPATTADHGLYDDLKWITEEPDKSENERIREILAERLIKRCPKQRFGRMSPKRISKAATSVTSVSSYDDLKPRISEPSGHLENRHVNFLSTSSAPSTSTSCFPVKISAADRQSPQETTEEFSIGSDSPSSGQNEEKQLELVELVERPNEAGALAFGSTDMHSKAECVDDAHAAETSLATASGNEGRVVPLSSALVPAGDVAKTEDEGLLDQAALCGPSKRRKKRHKHHKRSKSHRRRRLAKIKKKEREAAASRMATVVESRSESPATTGTSVVRPLLPHPSAELPIDWGASCSLSGVGHGLRDNEFQEDEVQLQDTGNVTIRIRTTTRTKASMVWPFGPPAD